MIYAVNKLTKEHQVSHPARSWDGYEWELLAANPGGWIDWKSDEYWSPMPDGSRCEIKLSSGDVFTIDDPEGWDWSGGGDQWIVAYRPLLDADAKPAWDGEGLPTAGCKCEILGTPTGSWSVGIVDYIDDKHCIWHWAGGSGETVHNRVYNIQFRPVRSEEDKAVDEMMATLGKTSGAAGTASICRELYREGYRKVK